MKHHILLSVILGVALLAAPYVFGAVTDRAGIYVWENQEHVLVCSDTASHIYTSINDVDAEIDSAQILIFTCPTWELLWDGLTDSTGMCWFDSLGIRTMYDRVALGESLMIHVVKTGYNDKYIRFTLHDTTRTEIVTAYLIPEYPCSAYTWSAHIFDRRTGRPLENAVASIVQIQSTWWCGDTAAPWGSGSGGQWTVTSDSDGLITAPIPRDMIVKITISAMGYEEYIVMDADKISGRLFLSPSSGYRR